VFGAHWNWRAFNYSSNVASVDARLASILNATNPNLTPFKSRGGKLIMYHGWADWLVSPQESINYYEAVANAQAKAARNHETKYEETGSFLRLFMVPGMAHCGGGPGLNSINALPSLDLWVEKGIAPKDIIASRVTGQTHVMTRPVCPYPQFPRYRGTGATSDAANFSCVSPASTSVR
jgi:feruloyl esterase